MISGDHEPSGKELEWSDKIVRPYQDVFVEISGKPESIVLKAKVDEQRNNFSCNFCDFWAETRKDVLIHSRTQCLCI